MPRPKLDLAAVLDQFQGQFYQSIYRDKISMSHWTFLMTQLFQAICNLTIFNFEVETDQASEKQWRSCKRIWDKEWNIAGGGPSKETLQELENFHIWFTGGTGTTPIFQPFRLDRDTLSSLPPGLCMASDTVMPKNWYIADTVGHQSSTGPVLPSMGTVNKLRNQGLDVSSCPKYPTSSAEGYPPDSVPSFEHTPSDANVAAWSSDANLFSAYCPSVSYSGPVGDGAWNQPDAQASSQVPLHKQPATAVPNLDFPAANLEQTRPTGDASESVYRIPRKQGTRGYAPRKEVQQGWSAPFYTLPSNHDP
ncbi:hypothetical protein ACLMJK_008648 [Lecanora helva]